MEHIDTYLEMTVITVYGIYKWWKKRQENRKEVEYKHSHSPENVTDIDRRVRHETRKIRDRYLAMRCYVIHFSNGTVTEAGLPLLKITFKHEAYIDWGDHPVQPTSKNFQGVDMPPMFLSPMYMTFKTGGYYLKDRGALEQDDYYYWLESYRVKSVRWFGIYKKGAIVAILVCHWPEPTDLSGKIIADIKEIKMKIEQIYAEIK